MNDLNRVISGKRFIKIKQNIDSEIHFEANINENAKKKFQDLKNTTFKHNVIDPTNGRIVKSIYGMKITKLNREKWDLIWQFYRDRHRTSVDDLLKKNTNKRMQIIYSGDPKKYYIGTEPFHNKSRIKKQNDELDVFIDDEYLDDITDNTPYSDDH